MKFKGIRGKNGWQAERTRSRQVSRKLPPPRPAGRARGAWHPCLKHSKEQHFSPIFYSCKYLHPEPKAAPAAVSGCGRSLDGEALTLDWKDGFYQLILIRAMTTSLLWGKSYFNIKECLTPLARSRPTRCKLFTHTKVTPPSPSSSARLYYVCSAFWHNFKFINLKMRSSSAARWAAAFEVGQELFGLPQKAKGTLI